MRPANASAQGRQQPAITAAPPAIAVAGAAGTSRAARAGAEVEVVVIVTLLVRLVLAAPSPVAARTRTLVPADYHFFTAKYRNRLVTLLPVTPLLADRCSRCNSLSLRACTSLYQ